MVPFAALLSALSEVPDPRRPQGRRYPLAHLLLFSVLAVLAGATSYRGILTFIGVHRERVAPPVGARLRPAPRHRTPPAPAPRDPHTAPSPGPGTRPCRAPPAASTPGRWPTGRRPRGRAWSRST